MNLVVDASAVAEILMRRPRATELERLVDGAETVIAPDLFVSEVANVFWKYQAFTGVKPEKCAAAYREALGIPDVYVPSMSLVEEAFDMACRTRHPVYDLLYLVLARRHSAVLATVDHRLADLCRRNGVRCK
jgi:predicted nucleic acid-binding protein